MKRLAKKPAMRRAFFVYAKRAVLRIGEPIFSSVCFPPAVRRDPVMAAETADVIAFV